MSEESIIVDGNSALNHSLKNSYQDFLSTAIPPTMQSMLKPHCLSNVRHYSQEEWETKVKSFMEKSGFTLDRDDETTLGFTSNTKCENFEWVRDYSKKTRSFVQFNAKQKINVRCTNENL